MSYPRSQLTEAATAAIGQAYVVGHLWWKKRSIVRTVCWSKDSEVWNHAAMATWRRGSSDINIQRRVELTLVQAEATILDDYLSIQSSLMLNVHSPTGFVSRGRSSHGGVTAVQREV